MPQYCTGCAATSDLFPDRSYYSFPDRIKDEHRFSRWAAALNRKNYIPAKTAKLCSAHFTESDYQPTSNLTARRKILKKTAVPSIGLEVGENKRPRKQPSLQNIPMDVQEELVQTSPAIVEPTFEYVIGEQMPGTSTDAAMQTLWNLTGIEETVLPSVTIAEPVSTLCVTEHHPIVDTVTGELHEIRMLNYIASHYLTMKIHADCNTATLTYLGFRSTMRQHLKHATLFYHT